MRKSQITPERKQRKKIFFNSICTPLEHPDSPQSLYLWAFSQFSPLLKLLGRMIYLAVSWYTFVHFILHIHLIFHLCVPRLEFLEPKWSQTFITNMIIIYIVRYTYFFNLSNIILTIVIVDCNLLQSQNSHFLNM